MIRLLSLAFFGLTFAAAGASDPVAGTWACQSMSAGAYTGRTCRLEPWLKLKSDHTYEWGRETGKWDLANGTLSLSGRSAKGRLNEDGKLVIEYDLRSTHYVLMLYRRAGD
jgi:hypothetical protein